MTTVAHHALDNDTIVAIATPPGKGGVGILRLSGPRAFKIAEKITHTAPLDRQAIFCRFRDSENSVVDEGLVIRFIAPRSFTGEDVVELHAHGSPAVLDVLLGVCVALGARLARAGEFSERAFLNGRIDLVQAEAIADLINATTAQAARSAARSLQGEFSILVNSLVNDLIRLRMYVEACLDFPEEEINFIDDKKIHAALSTLLLDIDAVETKARRGIILKEGLTAVIAGKPNAGKSSLLNILAGKEVAIVSSVGGTTRDILHIHISLDGVPIHIIDTAGLRETTDEIEAEGVRRARAEIKNADVLIYIIDSSETPDGSLDNEPLALVNIESEIPCITVYNKADISGLAIGVSDKGIALSAKTGVGVNFLTDKIKSLVDNDAAQEHTFTARRRHLEKLMVAKEFILCANKSLFADQAGELIAEDLRQAQLALSEITGVFTSDDLLGEIFSSFCIGK